MKKMTTLLISCALLNSVFANTGDQFDALNSSSEEIAKSDQGKIEALVKTANQGSLAYQSDAMQSVRKSLPLKPQAEGVIVFVSLGMPTLLLRQTIKEANTLGVPVVVRGLLHNDFRETSKVLYGILPNKGVKPLALASPYLVIC